MSNGRRFRILNVVDDYSRELVGQLAEFSISGSRVARFLDQLIETRGKHEGITCDNGTEYTSKAMIFWSKENQVKLNSIQPGKPKQNAFVESLNGKFRDTCLNLHWFRTIEEARYEIDQWRAKLLTIVYAIIMVAVVEVWLHSSPCYFIKNKY